MTFNNDCSRSKVMELIGSRLVVSYMTLLVTNIVSTTAFDLRYLISSVT